MHPTSADFWTSTSKTCAPHCPLDHPGPGPAETTPSDPPVHLDQADPPVSRNADDAAPLWLPRPEAAHLSRAANGTYYLRLVVPERVRAQYPGLPHELRRSTKTSQKAPALRRAREMCRELVTSLARPNTHMLVSSSPSTPPCQQGFRIEYLDGVLHTQVYPGANAHTLSLMAQVLPLFAQQPAAQWPAPPLPAQIPAAGGAPGWTGASAPGGLMHAPTQAQSPGPFQPAAPAGTPIEQPESARIAGEQDGTGTAQVAAGTSNTPAPLGIVWLSEAIDDWRENGPCRLSSHTWTFSYEPSFRVLRELLGNERRDIEQPDGTIVPNQWDIRVCDLTRGHIEQLQKLLKRMPKRQGQRQDGVEAQTLIAQAQAKKLPVQTPANVAKKLRHMYPFFKYAVRKEWISASIGGAFKLALEAADARSDVVSKAKGVHKAGAVALSAEELRRTYESEAYIAGALKRDWMHWCDPLRLYTGARVSEISQLHTNDIFEIEGVACISIINDAPKGDGTDSDSVGSISQANTLEEYRRLKNSASRRILPVHPELIRLGFLDWVRQRQEMAGPNPCLLFSGLKWAPKSGYGRRPSEHTLDLLKAAKVWEMRRKVGHSLRSSCAQELERVGMPGALIDRFLGHSLGTEREQAYSETNHGPAYPVRIALEFLKKTDFGVKFPSMTEIAALRRAKWAQEKKDARPIAKGSPKPAPTSNVPEAPAT